MGMKVKENKEYDIVRLILERRLFVLFFYFLPDYITAIIDCCELVLVFFSIGGKEEESLFIVLSATRHY